MRFSFLLLVASALGACASHNSHGIRVDPDNDLGELVSEAYVQMTNDLGAEIPAGEVAMAVDVDSVPVTWLLYDGPQPPEAAVDSEFVRRLVEDKFVRLLGTSLVSGQPGQTVDDADLRFNAWLLIDLRAMDAVTIQVTCALTHRDDPDFIMAGGASRFVAVQRLPCFGCREHWFRETGTELRGWRYDGQGSGVYFFGWVGGAHYYGNHYHGHSSAYRKN
jgi:hypothetical protein